MKPARRAENVPLYADWSVEFEEDVVSCGGGDGPEEVLSQVGLLQSVALVHLWHKRKTYLLLLTYILCHFPFPTKLKVQSHLHGSGNLSRRVDVHLVQQRLEEVLVLQDAEPRQMGLRRK